jgi:hypothetical protein
LARVWAPTLMQSPQGVMRDVADNPDQIKVCCCLFVVDALLTQTTLGRLLLAPLSFVACSVVVMPDACAAYSFCSCNIRALVSGLLARPCVHVRERRRSELTHVVYVQVVSMLISMPAHMWDTLEAEVHAHILTGLYAYLHACTRTHIHILAN